jgi:hypothetical protein
MQKRDYYVLAHLAPRDQINPEIGAKLDKIVEVARRAKPVI